MTATFNREVVTELRRCGFTYDDNAKGLHEKWVHESGKPMIVVPRNLKSRQTANGILKDAGSKLRL